jgi:hypothetical protein
MASHNQNEECDTSDIQCIANIAFHIGPTAEFLKDLQKKFLARKDRARIMFLGSGLDF